ncbi:MAG: PfkB family carbohydrate kinase [Candidatus Omnitrophota bacterium]
MLVITLNPSIDRTLFVKSRRPGVETRVLESRAAPGGKGVNVARALAGFGVKARSLTLKDILPQVLVRVNTTVIDGRGYSTRFLEPGPRLSAGEWKKVERYILGRLKGIKVLAICGSLPPGAPEGLYARLIAAARRKGILTALDASGVPLLKGVKAEPWCVKPNRDEAEALLGIKLNSTRAVRKVLQMLSEYGMTRVLLSLDKDGLAGFDGKEMFLARGPVRSGLTVGCGDASLAGFLAGHAKGFSFEDCLKQAAAAGAANVGVTTAGVFTRAAVDTARKKIKMERL